MIPSYKIWISVGMNDVNYDVLDQSKDIHSCFQCKQMSSYIDDLIKRYWAFRVLGENVFEKIKLRTCLFFSSRRGKGVYSNKTTSNNLLFHCHHELKGIQWEKERDYCKKNLFQLMGPFLAWNTRCVLLDVTITIHCTKSVDI